MTDYWCELAWLGGAIAEPGVTITVSGSTIESVTTGIGSPPDGAVVLRGLTLPGFANAHSHAFHRAMRGHTHAGSGSFWTWRDQMYGVASRLDPDNYHRLAQATFAEMALAGITVVGEFHYVHHQPDGRPYADPNAMGDALLTAAAEAGIRVTLLDTCYLRGQLSADGYQPVSPEQARFSDGTADGWVDRVGDLVASDRSRIGAAVHSVRAVEPDSMATVRTWAAANEAPIHIHLSEQPAENMQCQAVHGVTPTQLLEKTGMLDADLTAVHATHLTDDDIAALGAARVGCCFCPTTERDLADGIGPARALTDAGARLSLGSDSHAVIDMMEEARAVELDARLETLTRGNHSPPELLTAATRTGYECVGWDEGGRIEAGALADLTTVRMDSVRTAGSTPDSAVASAVFAATAADVDHVIVGGEVVVRDGSHLRIDVETALHDAIEEVRP